MKKKHCIVHIGMHKTGTTSIQTALYYKLNDPNFSYVNLGVPNHGPRIFSLFHEKPETYPTHVKNGWDAKKIKQFNEETKSLLIKEFNSENKSTMIISGEAISMLPKVSIQNFSIFLKKYFEKITIIGYVRTPKSYIESVFQQRLKSGVNTFSFLYPNYTNRFRKFDRFFGRENVHLKLFTPLNFPDKDVVRDFCNYFGIHINLTQSIKNNESLSREAISILYAYRKFGPGYGTGDKVIKENTLLIEKLRGIGSRKLTFSPSLIKPIIERNRADLEWMEKRLGVPLLENMISKEHDVKSENDLLLFDEDIITQLKESIGILDNNTKSTYLAQDIADLVHSLRYLK